ncbi:hypothetical protein EV127DRAFT_44899 [Xylaria flabelliformis]|nr:hypothetical protein EV127DRAFT_44899 [Xylaria flabelliformis]
MAELEALAQLAWSYADDDSLSLIFSLLREDAREVEFSSKGKQVEGTLTDVDLALQLYTQELERVAAYVSDRRMTKSMQEAVLTDTDALLECQQQENIARSDRQFALARSEGRVQEQTQTPTGNNASEAELDPESLERLTTIYVTGIREADGNKADNKEVNCDGSTDDSAELMSATSDCPESSSWASSRAPENTPQRPCTACRDMKHFLDLAQTPCQHDYCRECLDDLFRAAMLDESLFPPRCCRQAIPVDSNCLFLSSDIIQQFENKSLEFSTANRIYCHQPTCSSFIPPSTIKDGVAECPKCTVHTCITCKGATHEGDCPADEALQQVLQLSRQEEWQRCPKCSTMIELSTGCFHITCICRAEFCYLCAAQWKTCACAQWEERRLYDTAREIYNRDHNPHAPPGARANAIRYIAENLRQNHECDHEHWHYRSGRHRCSQCHDRLPNYIYDCQQCHILACRRCRYNRL